MGGPKGENITAQLQTSTMEPMSFRVGTKFKNKKNTHQDTFITIILWPSNALKRKIKTKNRAITENNISSSLNSLSLSKYYL